MASKTKTEDGNSYTKADYAYTPTDMPSDWKLRTAEYVNGKKKTTPAQVGRAIAALSSGGFRGNRVQLPADAVAGVKAKLRALHNRVNSGGAKSLPPHMQEAANEEPDEMPVSEAVTDTEITESELIIDLVEKAVRADGTMPVKIIQPGWGSSGYYSPDVLKRDGPKVFTEGMQMFWDHQTAAQEAEQPEGSLNNLAGVLISNATWQDSGKAGPGLYADAKVFKPYQEAINEMAPYIGLSIRANGKASQGEAAGRKGAVIQEISSAKSVDVVTKAGAGGQIISMFEAARNGSVRQAHTESQVVIPPDNGPIPPDTGQGVKTMSREINMDDLSDAEKKLAETNRKLEAYETLVTRFQETESRLKAMETNNARLQEGLLLRDARDFVTNELKDKQLPEPTRKRLLEALVANPPIVDGALDTTTYAMQVREAVKTETAYLAAVAGYGTGSITGMGGAPVVNQDSGEKAQKRLTEAFQGLGLNAEELKYATRLQ